MDKPENDKRMIWIDLEMTGLDSSRDEILEVAVIVTDSDLNTIAEAPVLAIHHPENRLEAMDEWNSRTHSESGLWQRVVDSDMDYAAAEQIMLEFLKPLVAVKRSPMCGNSICQDRRFLARLMPEFEQYFHYRNLDVSTLKELSYRWSPDILYGLQKESKHEALSDIRDSIEELQYYRGFMGELGGLYGAGT